MKCIQFKRVYILTVGYYTCIEIVWQCAKLTRKTDVFHFVASLLDKCDQRTHDPTDDITAPHKYLGKIDYYGKQVCTNSLFVMRSTVSASGKPP